MSSALMVALLSTSGCSLIAPLDVTYELEDGGPSTDAAMVDGQTPMDAAGLDGGMDDASLDAAMMDDAGPGGLCAENERVVANLCRSCPVGTVNEAGDDPMGADTVCDPRLCGLDEHVQANSCLPCPAGSGNEAGDDASGEDTTCDPTSAAPTSTSSRTPA